MSTEKGQKMTLKMCTGRFKIPLCFILRVVPVSYNQQIYAYLWVQCPLLGFGDDCVLDLLPTVYEVNSKVGVRRTENVFFGQVVTSDYPARREKVNSNAGFFHRLQVNSRKLKKFLTKI